MPCQDGPLRAITYHEYGGPEVLSVEETERPNAAEDEFLIRVHAAEACKSDCEMRSFDYAVKWFLIPLRLALGVRRPRRSILGLYFSGVVEEAGPKTTGFVPGDAVFGSAGLRQGAYGEFVAVPAKAPIAAKPTTMTHAEAAAVPLGGLNALHFLRRAEVSPGDNVLINGAGGVIGAYGVQIAHSMGATVTGVDASHKEAFVRSMGASEFIDYQTTDVTTVDARFDVIFDMVPGTRVAAMTSLLKPGGRYANGNPRLLTLLRAPLARFKDHTIIVAFADETSTALGELAQMIDAGDLGPIVDRVLPMEEASEAHRLVDTEERIGAVVLAIGPQANER